MIACLCEGTAEKTIMEILLDAGKLKFQREDLLEGEILRVRGGAQFAKRYLSKGIREKIRVYRILDSHNENFKISKPYQKKIEVINVVTSPEIEMLIIINEGLYDDFSRKKTKKKLKPSDYCKVKFKNKNIKSEAFVREYFSDIDQLIASIKEYQRITAVRENEKCLADLLV